MKGVTGENIFRIVSDILNDQPQGQRSKFLDALESTPGWRRIHVSDKPFARSLVAKLVSGSRRGLPEMMDFVR